MTSTNHWIAQRTIRNFKKRLTVILYYADGINTVRYTGTDKPFADKLTWDFDMETMISGYIIVHTDEQGTKSDVQKSAFSARLLPGDTLNLDFTKLKFSPP